MSIEFTNKADRSGNGGFYIHVPANNPELIEHIYRFGDVDLCSSIKSYCEVGGLPVPEELVASVSEIKEPEVVTTASEAQTVTTIGDVPEEHKN